MYEVYCNEMTVQCSIRSEMIKFQNIDRKPLHLQVALLLMLIQTSSLTIQVTTVKSFEKKIMTFIEIICPQEKNSMKRIEEGRKKESD